MQYIDNITQWPNKESFCKKFSQNNSNENRNLQYGHVILTWTWQGNKTAEPRIYIFTSFRSSFLEGASWGHVSQFLLFIYIVESRDYFYVINFYIYDINKCVLDLLNKDLRKPIYLYVWYVLSVCLYSASFVFASLQDLMSKILSLDIILQLWHLIGCFQML